MAGLTTADIAASHVGDGLLRFHDARLPPDCPSVFSRYGLPMSGNLRARSDEITPARSDEIVALLAARGPLSLEVLARLVNVAPVALRRHLDEHPCLVPTPEEEWVSGLRVADGVAFTHELTAIEVTSGVLSADDDLAVWGQFAIGGLPLAGGGEGRAATALGLPPGIRDDPPPGPGLFGPRLSRPHTSRAGLF